MNRRSFFKRMFCGIATAIGLPLVVKGTQTLSMDVPVPCGKKLLSFNGVPVKSMHKISEITVTGSINGYDRIYRRDYNYKSSPVFFSCTEEVYEELERVYKK